MVDLTSQYFHFENHFRRISSISAKTEKGNSCNAMDYSPVLVFLGLRTEGVWYRYRLGDQFFLELLSMCSRNSSRCLTESRRLLLSSHT